MELRRDLRNVGGLLAVAVLAAACSGPVAEPGAEEGAESGGGGGSSNQVVYWSMFSTGEPMQQILQDCSDRFVEENPDIDVEINWAGRDVLTRLQGAINAGQQVDIVDHSNDRIRSAVVANDLALNLDEYLQEPAYGAESGTWLDTFEPGAVEAFAEDDGTYMIPRDVYVSGMWYNEDMLAEAGIEPPTTGMTWEEFLEILETVAAENPGVSPLGADGNIDFYNNWWFSYLAIRIAGLEAFQAAANDETGESWRQPEFLRAAQMVRDLQDRGYFQSGFEGSVFPAAQVQWVNGEIAMMLMGAWLPKEMEEQAPEDFNMGLFAFPNVEGGEGNDLVEYWSNAFTVLKDSPNPDAAVEWVKFIMSPEGCGDDIAEAGWPVPLADAPTPESHEGQAEILAEYEVMGQRGGLNDDLPDYVTGALNLCNDPFFQLQSTPEEFIDCLATESARFWASS